MTRNTSKWPRKLAESRSASSGTLQAIGDCIAAQYGAAHKGENEMTHFRTDNTKGYDARDLIELNARMERAITQRGLTRDDEDAITALAEDVLAQFDCDASLTSDEAACDSRRVSE